MASEVYKTESESSTLRLIPRLNYFSHDFLSRELMSKTLSRLNWVQNLIKWLNFKVETNVLKLNLMLLKIEEKIIDRHTQDS